MAAALFAKAAGVSVLLIEHNEKLGKKLYITGKGRCNLSNLCDLDTFLENVPRNPRFLYPALTFLSPQKLRGWMEDLGCDTILERGNRVFPKSQKASDVTRALAGKLTPQEVRLKAEAASLIIEGNGVQGVRLSNGETLRARAVVLATGGMSYPLTGSTGDGYRMAGEAGHRVTALSPALTGLSASDAWIRSAQGLTLKNVRLMAEWGKRGQFLDQGEMLFTHFGVSGPLVLTLSSMLADVNLDRLRVRIDLKPALDRDQLKNRLALDISRSGRKQLGTILPGYLPKSLADVFPGLTGVSGEKPVSQLTGAERDALVDGMKRLPIHVTGLRPFSEAVITRGGVDVKEVNPSTMASKLVDGLYFAGEVLDVDAMTGGFNLQIAFSTGALAGESAAKFILNQ